MFCVNYVLLYKYFIYKVLAGLEITTDHHCGEETFQSIFQPIQLRLL